MIDEEERIIKSSEIEVERQVFSNNISYRDTNSTLSTRYASRRELPSKEVLVAKNYDVNKVNPPLPHGINLQRRVSVKR